MADQRVVRVGLWVLTVVALVVGVWQYFFTHSFYVDVPTVDLDPPYSRHLLSDVGGLMLALALITGYAAVRPERHLVRAALLGYLVYTGTHLGFHLTHLDGFGTGDAVQLGVLLGVFALIPIVLLVLTERHAASWKTSARV